MSKENTAAHVVDEVLPLPRLAALGLQHVLVMYAGAIAVPLIVGRALKLPPEDVAFLISADLFACGLVTLIQSLGVKAGLALNPATPLHCLDYVIDRLDLILLMSVNPGFGGQSFIESTLPKIEAVRKRIDQSGRDIWLEIAGGVKADNAERIGSAGADTLVAGSAIFNGGRYQQAIHAIRMQASAGRHARVTLQ